MYNLSFVNLKKNAALLNVDWLVRSISMFKKGIILFKSFEININLSSIVLSLGLVFLFPNWNEYFFLSNHNHQLQSTFEGIWIFNKLLFKVSILVNHNILFMHKQLAKFQICFSCTKSLPQESNNTKISFLQKENWIYKIFSFAESLIFECVRSKINVVDLFCKLLMTNPECNLSLPAVSQNKPEHFC